MHLILFIVFAGFCLAGAINLLLQSHPISSALSLIVVMTSLAVLYLLLGAEFLAAAQVIVYAGAIMVLFTFVVMLLNAGREERTLGSRAARARGLSRSRRPFWACIATVILARAGTRHRRTQRWPHHPAQEPRLLSTVLFTKLLLPFEVTSVLILIAILGAVALARHGDGDPEGTEKGRPQSESLLHLLQQEVPLSWYLLLERGAVFARRGRLPHQAQPDHRLHVD